MESRLLRGLLPNLLLTRKTNPETLDSVFLQPQQVVLVVHNAIPGQYMFLFPVLFSY
jgi:hypothetical protein